MDEITDHRQLDDAVLNFDVSDEALERAGGTGLKNAANPTLPSALICIPFVEAKKQRSRTGSVIIRKRFYIAAFAVPASGV